jgi:hypothetical protein
MQAAFSKAREIAHAAVAVLGSLAASQALVLTFLASLGVHISALDLAQKVGAAGAVLAVVSKGIDSLNNMVTSKANAGVVTNVVNAAAASAPPH